MPVGGGPTADADVAAGIVRDLEPAFAVPMHYRIPAVDFLEPPERFLALFEDVHHVGDGEWSVPAERRPGTRVVVLQPPGA